MEGEFNLLPFLEKCTENNVIVVFISQADYDAINLSKYTAGRTAIKAGAISGADMTLEAALTKMMWLTGNYEDQEVIRKLFQKDLSGELTEN